MVHIEHDGILYRGPGRAVPQEVWGPKKGWSSYGGATPKGVEWGEVITDAQAEALKSEHMANGRSGATRKAA